MAHRAATASRNPARSRSPTRSRSNFGDMFDFKSGGESHRTFFCPPRWSAGEHPSARLQLGSPMRSLSPPVFASVVLLSIALAMAAISCRRHDAAAAAPPVLAKTPVVLDLAKFTAGPIGAPFEGKPWISH